MTTITRETWERAGLDRALADALNPAFGASEEWTLSDLARFFADGAMLADRRAADEIASLRAQLTDMERERDVSRGNAQMHMEAARDLAVQLEAAQADAQRYRWLRDHPRWSIAYRIKQRTNSTEWRMRDEGEWWGAWWPTHEQAIDHAAAIHKAREQSK